MKTIRSMMVGAVVLGLSVGACTPSPEKVCAHASEVMSAAEHQSAAESSHDRESCVRDLTTIQQGHPAEYKTAAKCMMSASTRDAMMACMMPLLPLMMAAHH